MNARRHLGFESSSLVECSSLMALCCGQDAPHGAVTSGWQWGFGYGPFSPLAVGWCQSLFSVTLTPVRCHARHRDR